MALATLASFSGFTDNAPLSPAYFNSKATELVSMITTVNSAGTDFGILQSSSTYSMPVGTDWILRSVDSGGAVWNLRIFGGPNGTDDTASLWSVCKLAQAAGGGRIVVPPGLWYINADYSQTTGSPNLYPRTTLELQSGATLQAITNALTTYAVVRVDNSRDVRIEGGGAIVGERAAHTGGSGEQGFGVMIRGSENVTVAGISASTCWGDGIYVGSTSTSTICRNILLDGVTVYHNRRNNISVVACDGFRAVNVSSSSASGTAPEAGIDLEPNAGTDVRNCLISGGRYWDNDTYGVLMAGAQHSQVAHIQADRNGLYGIYAVIVSAGSVRDILIADNQVYGTTGAGGGGIVVNSADSVTVIGNSCSTNSGEGIRLQTVNDAVVIGNRLRGNRGDGLDLTTCARVVAADNSAVSNTIYGIEVTTLTDGVIRGNIASQNSAGIVVGGSCQRINVADNGVMLNWLDGINVNQSTVTTVTITGNQASSNSRYGIVVDRAFDAMVQGNQCSNNSKPGIITIDAVRAVIIGNHCDGNSGVAHQQEGNIDITGSSVSCAVVGNVCYAGSGSTQAGYGIRVRSACSDTAVAGNVVMFGGTRSAISNDAPSTYLSGNLTGVNAVWDRASFRTLAVGSLTSASVSTNEMAFALSASGASLAIRSGGTVWYFSSSLSTNG